MLILEGRLPFEGTFSLLFSPADPLGDLSAGVEGVSSVAELAMGRVSVVFISWNGSTIYGCSLIEEFLLNIML